MPEEQPSKTGGAKRTVDTFVRLLIALVFFQCLNSLVDVWTETQRTETRDDIRDLLEIIREQTSPERQAQQQETVGQILVTMDCNTRVALEEALGQLDFPVDLTPEGRCPE